ncbi:MAG TPA: CopG family transcriptional regulator [Solirubrobacteraceae bacterium]|nr:CopG family transcriptional regulator [Solirubrobacteraceae bacterium]
MRRTTIMLPDDLDARLRHEARRRGVSIADVARRAIEEQLPEPAQNGALSFFAVGTGSPADASRRVEDFVGPAISRRHPAS